jgi:hypothetical protein
LLRKMADDPGALRLILHCRGLKYYLIS